MGFRHFFTIILCVFIGCSSLKAQSVPDYASSILICRSKQCAPLEKTMTASFLFNRLIALFESNLNHDILLCDADPITHVCFDKALSISAVAGVTSAQLSIPAARLLDAKLKKGKLGFDFILSYYLTANGLPVRCQNSLSELTIASLKNLQINSNAFSCALTQTGNPNFNITYALDYIDFDYGTLGAYYTFGSSQIVRGEKTGYLLMRFTKPQKSTVNEINLNVKSTGGTTPLQQIAPSLVAPITPVNQTPAFGQQLNMEQIAKILGKTSSDASPQTPSSVSSSGLPIVSVTSDGRIVPKQKEDAYQAQKKARQEEIKAEEKLESTPSSTVKKEEPMTISPLVKETRSSATPWQIGEESVDEETTSPTYQVPSFNNSFFKKK